VEKKKAPDAIRKLVNDWYNSNLLHTK